MPLESGKSREAISSNIKTERAAGKSEKQSVAIALSKSREDAKETTESLRAKGRELLKGLPTSRETHYPNTKEEQDRAERERSKSRGDALASLADSASQLKERADACFGREDDWSPEARKAAAEARKHGSPQRSTREQRLSNNMEELVERGKKVERDNPGYGERMIERGKRSLAEKAVKGLFKAHRRGDEEDSRSDAYDPATGGSMETLSRIRSDAARADDFGSELGLLLLAWYGLDILRLVAWGLDEALAKISALLRSEKSPERRKVLTKAQEKLEQMKLEKRAEALRSGKRKDAARADIDPFTITMATIAGWSVYEIVQNIRYLRRLKDEGEKTQEIIDRLEDELKKRQARGDAKLDLKKESAEIKGLLEEWAKQDPAAVKQLAEKLEKLPSRRKDDHRVIGGVKLGDASGSSAEEILAPLRKEIASIEADLKVPGLYTDPADKRREQAHLRKLKDELEQRQRNLDKTKAAAKATGGRTAG